MDIIPAIDPRGYTRMSTSELRQAFLVDGLFQPGALVLKYWETDRTVIGGAVPGATKLSLACPRELAATYFNERRELGIINIGDAGTVEVDGTVYSMQPLDCLYVGRGVRNVAFTSANAASPAQYYLLSYPAHTTYPTAQAALAQTPPTELGDATQANARTLYKFIHTGGIKSCQLAFQWIAFKNTEMAVLVTAIGVFCCGACRGPQTPTYQHLLAWFLERSLWAPSLAAAMSG